jgi:hypothetical protein
MLKKVVLPVSGIVNKQVKPYKQVSDFMTYFLVEDINRLSTYHGVDREVLKKNMTLYVELDGHLFGVCAFNYIDKLASYTKQTLMQELVDMFNRSMDRGTCRNYGMAQYLNRVEEYDRLVKQRHKQRELEEQERERKDRERELRERAQRESELKQSAKVFANGGSILAGDFIDLCDMFNIKLPLRTRGWTLKSLRSISVDSYSYHGNDSKVILNYAEQLYEVLKQY